MRIFSDKTYYSVDFINNELKQLIKNDKNKFITKNFKFKKADSLKEEINNFINTCYGKDVPMTDGISGETALKVAKKITRGF
jgi:hypothetical protein